MPFATLHSLSAADLQAMADGTLEDTVTDLDFLETLGAQKCILVPPWVIRVQPEGGLVKVTQLVYTVDGKLDKPRILLNVARVMMRQGRFGRRFSI